jgi:hypothetical protein
MPDGYVFYDALGGQVYYLNLTAAAVLELCDGIKNAGLIADILKGSFGLPEPPLDEVNTCLQALVSAGLIEEVHSRKFSFKKLFSPFFPKLTNPDTSHNIFLTRGGIDQGQILRLI